MSAHYAGERWKAEVLLPCAWRLGMVPWTGLNFTCSGAEEGPSGEFCQPDPS